MMNLVFIAPPAAGKGTFSTMLKNDYGYVHISAGDLLRNIDESSSVYEEVQDILKQGKLVPTSIISSLLKEKLISIKGKPFILDGYPRSLEQTTELDNILSSAGVKIDKAIYLDVELDTALKRILGRLSCPVCKRDYNSLTGFNTPKEEGLCDVCHTPLVKRSDDNEDSFKIRYQTYINETEPVVSYFENKGLLIKLDVNRSTDEVYNELKKEIGL